MALFNLGIPRCLKCDMKLLRKHENCGKSKNCTWLECALCKRTYDPWRKRANGKMAYFTWPPA